MKVNGQTYRTIWLKPGDDFVVQVIDQTLLPHRFEIVELTRVEDMRRAISNMTVRGAGLIGASAAYGMYLAALEAPNTGFESFLRTAAAALKATRPTATNLGWAVDRMLSALAKSDTAAQKRILARHEAQAIADEDEAHCRRIGAHGKALIERIALRKGGQPVNILTHCNAGWLAFVDVGSATAPLYAAHDAGIALHVWVDETRPRNQGASLTAWELGQHGVPHTLIADNAGGHLMQHGMVDMVITGADRVTRCGDVANKIGTYLKALAAYDNHIPMVVALPSSTFDFSLREGVFGIPIEERDAAEVRYISGRNAQGAVESVLLCPPSTAARNWGFDVTPARLISKLICERGVCDASEASILSLFPEQRSSLAPTDDGYIKYTSHRRDGVVPLSAALGELNQARTRLFDLGLVGVYPNGVGYGNVSIRAMGDQFVITASATGEARELTAEQFSLVEAFSLETNQVHCVGALHASSESMTHGALYGARPEVHCVMHIHSRLLFDALQTSGAAATAADIAYGTPAMAQAIVQITLAPTALPALLVMAGHDEGVVAYGTDIGSVLHLIETSLRKEMGS